MRISQPLSDVRHQFRRALTRAVAGEPGFELGGGAEAEDAAQVERVVEAGALVVEHDVVGAGHAHDVVDAGGAEQREQRVHVVLVGLGVVGVADVAAHGQAEQLAAEVVFEAGAEDLLAVVEILGADEADDGVDQHGAEAAGDGVGAGFEGLLVDCRGWALAESALPWPVSKYMMLSPIAPSAQAAPRRSACRGHAWASSSRARLTPKDAVGGFGAGDGLEDEVDGRAALERFHLRGDVGEHAALRGDVRSAGASASIRRSRSMWCRSCRRRG